MVNSKKMHLYQYVYRTQVGEVPEGKVLTRSCKNTKCINPDHLILTTRGELNAQVKRKPYEFIVDEATGCFNVINVKNVVREKFGRSVSIQKFIYEQCFGEVPEGEVVSHKCGNKKCINPEHLTLTTKAGVVNQIVKKYVANPVDFDIDPVTGCFNCNSHPEIRGYHYMRVNGKSIGVHRFVYEQMFGEIPEGLVVRHRCDNPHCINPEHLELGTQADNIRDMVERGRQAKGSMTKSAKLTEQDVCEIRRRLDAGERVCDLARAFEVHYMTIVRIKQKKIWKHVD